MGRGGGRSRSEAEVSELAENVLEDQEERSADVKKGGRGGVREAESSAANS